MGNEPIAINEPTVVRRNLDAEQASPRMVDFSSLALAFIRVLLPGGIRLRNTGNGPLACARST